MLNAHKLHDCLTRPRPHVARVDLMVETSLKGQNGSRLASSGILVQKPRAAPAVSGPRRTRVPNLRSSALREPEPPQHPVRRPGNGMNASRLVRHQDGLFGRSKRRRTRRPRKRACACRSSGLSTRPAIPAAAWGVSPPQSTVSCSGLTTDRMSAPGEVSLNPRAGTPPTPIRPRAGWAVAKAVERRHGASPDLAWGGRVGCSAAWGIDGCTDCGCWV